MPARPAQPRGDRGLADRENQSYDRADGHHRFHAVRGHLLELAGDGAAAAAEFRAAAAGTANLRVRHYLTAKAASLAAGRAEGAG